jgi:transcription-repair coupling factor (superfamily II helicase)
LIQFESSERLNDILIKEMLTKYSKQIVLKNCEKPVFAYKIDGFKKEMIIDNIKNMLESINKLLNKSKIV